MASLEFIAGRIEGAEKKLEKLNKKMGRIEVAKSHNYESENPYSYSDWDFRSTMKEIEKTMKSLEKYKEQLQVENEKAASRNVEVIDKFLDRWLSECIGFFESEYERYIEDSHEHHRIYEEYLNISNNMSIPKEERAAARKAGTEEYRKFKERWTHVTQFDHGSLPWHDTMVKDLQAEKIRKYDDIIERTNKIVGKITSAEHLAISPKGNLDGVIEGTKGNAKVQTIGAGGYNIQCFHFRTLIHKL